MKSAQPRKASRESRLEYRVPVRLHAAIEIDGQPVRALVRDLSTNGLSLAVDRARLALSAPLGGIARGRRVVVRIPTRETTLVLPGEIAWARDLSAGGGDLVIAGVRLEATLPEPTRATLRAWILHALSAVRDAARWVLESQWERAASALREIGFESPSHAVLGGVLRYAANLG